MPKKFIVLNIFCLLLAVFIFSSNIQVSISQQNKVFGTPTLVRYSENFDSVTAPDIPDGWNVSSTGSGSGFITTQDTPNTAPNTLFTASPGTTSSASVTSPSLFIFGSDTRLNFNHRYVLENSWDGAVLEIKINDGEFIDILEAGGEFINGGYTTVLNPSTNPLENRLAWSGANQGLFANVSVKLPVSTFRQIVQFRWVFGSNESFGGPDFGWRIDTVTLEEVPTGLNTNSITISDNIPATPYPSEIKVSGLQGSVTGVVVNIENFSHDSPDDVDILLISPSGRSVTLMSDAGGSTPVNDIILTFDDSGNSTLPDNSEIDSGVYKPTNFEGVDVYPNPAPKTSPENNLSDFFGDIPNGTWSLFVVDDNGNNAGEITNGWNLSILSSVNACFFTVDPLFVSFPHTGGLDSFEITIPDGCIWTATINNSFINFDSTNDKTFNGIGSDEIGYNVDLNFGAAKTGLITVSDGFNNRTIQIQQSSGCPFSLAQNSINISSNGGIGSVDVEAGVNCVWNAFSDVNWIEVTSEEENGNGTANFNISPNATGLARSATIVIGARTLLINQLATSAATRFDFDGDGRSDISVYRDGTWYLQQSTDGFSVIQFGLATDLITPADFDGDGKADVSVYREGVWYILRSSDGQFVVIQFGLADDIPCPADYSGDGTAELCVYRNGTWFTQNLVNNQQQTVKFGLANDKPVFSDYDGDGKTDFAVYRNGVWFILQSTDGFAAVQFGISTDIPVTGDYNGDGRSDLNVYRNGTWHTLTNFQNYTQTQFGIATDIPVSADFDGDGSTDYAVYREGVWYVLQTANNQSFITQFGISTDQPIPNAFVP